MRSPKVVSVICAGLALASIVTEIVTEIVTNIVYIHPTEIVTVVTDGESALTLPPFPPVVSSSKAGQRSPTHHYKSRPRSCSPCPSSSISAGWQGTDFISTILYHHNIHRRNHSAPNATYDYAMARYAAEVAARCHYTHDLTPGGGGYGQNIAAYGTTDNPAAIPATKAAADAITNMWYNGEVNLFLPSYYGQENPPFSNFEAWGHFSQIVWQGSTSVGCATHLCDAGQIFSMPTWFTVCNYSPAGNIGGAYNKNIKQPLGHPTVLA